jgi:hypothetical protein
MAAISSLEKTRCTFSSLGAIDQEDLEMKRLVTVFALCALLFALCSVSSAQQPASFVSASASFQFAKHLGYEGVGKGANIGGGFRLLGSFYVTQDLERVAETKVGLHEGRTYISTTGLQLHGNGGWFARAAIAVGNHKNEAYTKTATRAHFGGGWEKLDRVSQLPLLSMSAVAVVPLSDPNAIWGVKVTIRGFYEFRERPFGITGKWTGNIFNVRDSFGPRRVWQGYHSVEFGLFFNLSAITGS